MLFYIMVKMIAIHIIAKTGLISAYFSIKLASAAAKCGTYKISKTNSKGIHSRGKETSDKS